MDSAYKGYQSDDPNKPYYKKSINVGSSLNGSVDMPSTGAADGFYPDTLLEERGHTHGEYKDGAAIIQATKNLWRAHPGWLDLNNCQKESFDMLATKAGRILAGDQNCVDSWSDISGYAQLIVNMLKK